MLADSALAMQPVFAERRSVRPQQSTDSRQGLAWLPFPLRWAGPRGNVSSLRLGSRVLGPVLDVQQHFRRDLSLQLEDAVRRVGHNSRRAIDALRQVRHFYILALASTGRC